VSGNAGVVASIVNHYNHIKYQSQSKSYNLIQNHQFTTV